MAQALRQIGATHTSEGRTICEYKGIVTGETIIGVELDFETLGSASGMLMVTATGTAVVLG